MTALAVNAERLLARLHTLGQIGRDKAGRLVRLAASDADKAGRDQLAAWMAEAGLELAVDAIGNMFGLWREATGPEAAPVLLGMMFSRMPRPPRQSLLLGPSTVFCVAVAACTVVIRPRLMPHLSLSTLATGARQLVVQEALLSTA